VSVSALACCATGGGSLRNRLRVAFYHGVGRRFVVLGHGSPLLLVGLVARASRLHAAEHAQRDAIRAACDAGASPRQIATEAVLSPEDVRRIGRADPEFPYLVTVERRAVSPLDPAARASRHAPSRGRTRKPHCRASAGRNVRGHQGAASRQEGVCLSLAGIRRRRSRLERPNGCSSRPGRRRGRRTWCAGRSAAPCASTTGLASTRRAPAAAAAREHGYPSGGPGADSLGTERRRRAPAEHVSGCRAAVGVVLEQPVAGRRDRAHGRSCPRARARTTATRTLARRTPSNCRAPRP
jgi:hypothetical protein